jgi:hypothetical protein
VLAAGDDLWAIDRSPELLRLDPATAEVKQRIRLAKEQPYWYDLAVGHGALWVSIEGLLERRNLRTLKVEESVEFGTHPLWISPGADSVWVTAANREEVMRLDPQTLEVLEVLDIGDYAGWLVEAFGDGWISALDHNAVYRVSI